MQPDTTGVLSKVLREPALFDSLSPVEQIALKKDIQSTSAALKPEIMATHIPSSSAETADSTVCLVLNLQVGERKFMTTAETLARESAYFAELLSGPAGNRLATDNMIMLDADGDLFAHILRYLRRGVLPVFYDNVKGHDHVLYMALLEEVRFFRIPRLEQWLDEKKYLHAVKVFYDIDMMEGCRGHGLTVPSGQMVEYRPVETTKRVYVCPRAIYVHTKPSDCGKECEKRRITPGYEYATTAVMQTVVITKEVLFNGDLCLEGR